MVLPKDDRTNYAFKRDDILDHDFGSFVDVSTCLDIQTSEFEQMMAHLPF